MIAAVRPVYAGFFIVLAACGGGGGGDASSPAPQPEPRVQLGEIIANATAEQTAQFARGKAIAQRRFTAADGHGPQFNVDSCVACHEKPVTGGSAGRYRNFNLVAEDNAQTGGFTMTGVNGIQPQFTRATESRVATDTRTNVIAVRNPVPFFGMGLIAGIADAHIEANADPSDADGDGISGRPNFDRDRLGRFGRKAQSASVEAFIRGPLFNHLGITTNPLPPHLRQELGLPVAAADKRFAPDWLDLLGIGEALAQAASPDRPTRDDDGVPDPELGQAELFDLVAFTLLLAPPSPDEPTAETRAGETLFTNIGCGGCHIPELPGRDGPVRAYSDLLLHDMGPELADGIRMGVSGTETEFRTQPLWGIAAAAPYLHDGRADTLDEAIRWHGGEAEAVREAYIALPAADRALLIAFLESLGGAAQRTAGLLPPQAPIPPVGSYGGPARELSADEISRFENGRAVFDRDFALSAGLGTVFNGDACRACHFDPVIGGAGPIDVNVIRHGALSESGEFTAPPIGTILHRFTTVSSERANDFSAADANVFEMRQTPAIFGLGLIEQIPAEVITGLADPDDSDGDGISGRAHRLADGRLGRFGWKAQVPSLQEFARDAASAELGLSLPAEAGQSFGVTGDDDAVADPEIALDELQDLVFFMQLLAPPPRSSRDAALEASGELVFSEVGCSGCHVPSLDTADGTSVPLFSDLLLHDVSQPGEAPGVADGLATPFELRTPPLWGLARTAPYMHDGRSATVVEAIGRHGGEAEAARQAFDALDPDSRAALIAFLESL